jgi:phosphomannomutase
MSTVIKSGIKFGTSGWRAIVADEFTMANIRLAVAGIAAYVKTQPEPHRVLPPQEAKTASWGPRVLVGRDPRFLGETFVDIAAQVLAGAGVMPIVIPEAAPTPAIAYAVRTWKTAGAINFTASHNPPEYNGIKFSTHDGAPALPEVTKQIEAAIAALVAGGNGGEPIPSLGAPPKGFETADVKPAFLKRLAELVDLKAIAKSGIKVVYDPFWGAGRGYRRFTTIAMCCLAAMRLSRTTTCLAIARPRCGRSARRSALRRMEMRTASGSWTGMEHFCNPIT